MKCCYRWDDEESQKRKEKENNSMRIPPPNETNPTDNRNRTHMNASTKNIYDEEQDNNTFFIIKRVNARTRQQQAQAHIRNATQIHTEKHTYIYRR
mmetsp:Transcript_10782/g.30889  ORF Transcript_10782/g.30889 Transcript_10782/m.30889 type:complete len:96 (+) Transcript_10782:70-357(+)